MKKEDDLMDLSEGAKYLGIGRTTLYLRLKERDVKPANYNPMLRRQKEPKYTKAQLDELKEHCASAA